MTTELDAVAAKRTRRRRMDEANGEVVIQAIETV